MKRFKVFSKFSLVVLLVSGLLLGLTSSLAMPSEHKEEITLNVALEAGTMADAAKSVVPTFEKQYPNINIKIIPLSYTTYQTKLNNVLSTGAGTYDVYEGHMIINGAFIRNGWAIPLDKYIEKYNLDTDDFLSAYWMIGTLAGKASQVNPKGSVYGIPFNGGVMLSVYRKDLYKKYGLPIPETWEQFVENVKELNASEKGLNGIALCGARAQNSQVWYDFYNMALNMGERKLPLQRVDENTIKVQMYNPGNLKALQLYSDFVNKLKVTPSGMREYRYSEKNTAIAQANAAHTFQWMLPGYKALEDPEQSEVAGQLGYSSMPGKGAAVTGGWTLSIANTSKHPEAAFKFIKFLTNKENNIKLAREYGNAPVRQSAVESEKFKEDFGPLADGYTKASKTGLALQSGAPSLAVWHRIIDFINYRLTDAIFKGESPEKMLKEADEQIATFLENQGYETVIPE